MAKLVALFVVVPALELLLLIEIGRRMGFLATFGLILLTGFLGAALARWQGLGVWQRFQREMAKGRIPTTELLDGVIVLLAAGVLLTPGILTDLAGFLCLIPATRAILRRALVRWFDQRVRQGTLNFSFRTGFRPGPSDDVIDITPTRSDDDQTLLK